MLKKTLVMPSFAQLTDGTLLNLGLTMNDFRILGIAAVMLFIVSLMQEKGIRVRDWLQEKPLALRWLLLYILLFFTIFFFTTTSDGGFMYAAF